MTPLEKKTCRKSSQNWFLRSKAGKLPPCLWPVEEAPANTSKHAHTLGRFRTEYTILYIFRFCLYIAVFLVVRMRAPPRALHFPTASSVAPSLPSRNKYTRRPTTNCKRSWERRGLPTLKWDSCKPPFLANHKKQRNGPTEMKKTMHVWQHTTEMCCFFPRAPKAKTNAPTVVLFQ